MNKSKQTVGKTLWDSVPLRKGKLVGMLTDKLALDALPNTRGSVSEPNETGFRTITGLGVQKVYKKLPSKFR